MILYLATNCGKNIARFFVTIFYVFLVTSSWASNTENIIKPLFTASSHIEKRGKKGVSQTQKLSKQSVPLSHALLEHSTVGLPLEKPFTGGPTQPEMSSFKPVSADNLVNLFTGDFSYNIPLLDVGGYPINIFYDGNISPEQEASWVGLGWNINPGTINRNMRGVPDDFDGTDILEQTQGMKSNKTFGVTFGADFELLGIKKLKIASIAFASTTTSTGFTAGLSLGVSFNNYLGPAIDFGLKGGFSSQAAKNSGSEKSPFGVKLGLNINNSSRNGVTISPNVSFVGSLHKANKSYSMGIGLSTSYNSRTGIRSLQLTDQVSISKQSEKINIGVKGRGIIDKQHYSSSIFSQNLASTSISFLKPSYIPAIRMPISNSVQTGHFQLGHASFGAEADFEAEISIQESDIPLADRKQSKPLVGYLYYEKANGNSNAVMDFTRIGDQEVTPNTPIISAPQYTYDVFSISGEGTGGTIRAYRNDLGYVRDNLTRTKDKSFSLGKDLGVGGQYGGNFGIIKTPSTYSEWGNGNKLRDAIPFIEKQGSFENVYFRNPGESSVLQNGQFDAIGGTDLVRYVIGGTDQTPTIEPKLKRIDKTGENVTVLSGTALPANTDLYNYNQTILSKQRKKRTQVVNFLTAFDASIIGLDKKINTYQQGAILKTDKTLDFTEIDRYSETGGYRKKHHISQINVTEGDGKRYIYGIPVYNITQKDFTFSVNNPNNSQLNESTNLVSYKANYASEESSLIEGPESTLIDGYVQTSTTPAYAHSFLLSGLLSPDYVDVTGNGITEDDLGSAVKFNYSMMQTSYKWRAPHVIDLADDSDPLNPVLGKANFNPGHRTSFKDDKGLVVYGERETWYLHSLESKTMIAVFTLGCRFDGEGTTSTSGQGGVNSTDNTIKRLEKITLYSKADLKKNGLINAKPIKTVHFEYSYELCRGTTDNSGATINACTNLTETNAGGKLTLKKIYFTFNGQNRAAKNQYVFGYGNTEGNTTDNPNYSMNSSDRWGNYKKSDINPGSLNNSDYPYSAQVSNTITNEKINQNASAWCLKKILLPSGGQIEVTYESDDYAFVQNKRAAVMTPIAGFTHDYNQPFSNKLYGGLYLGQANNLFVRENSYVIIDLPQPYTCTTTIGTPCTGEVLKEYIRSKYLEGQTQLAFRLAVQMPKGLEYMTAYGDIEDYGAVPSSNSRIWVKLKHVGDDNLSPLSLTAIEYLREQLPGQAYPAYDVSGQSSLKQIGTMLVGMLDGLTEIFKDQVAHLRSKGLARSVDISKCFVRLNELDGYKKGGGNRVKSVKIRNNWKKMTAKGVPTNGEAESVYGQEYDYTTKEKLNGIERTISSGVASYEPAIGGEENPFQTILRIGNSVPMGPTSYGAIEMPYLDAFFPSPMVGYSKVTVRSIKNYPSVGEAPKKTRSGIGKQVTEFYTSKDYPVKWSYTSLDHESSKEAASNFSAIFWSYAFNSRALSQGFLVELNDMNGKMKSQASYPENDELTPINYTENFYKNIGGNGLNEQFDFITTANNGAITPGNMGIDIELMTDTREFKVESSSLQVQAQLDLFPLPPPFTWLPFIWPVASNSENVYRAVTCTKIINYHSVIDKVVVIDKGSMVSTQNMVFDAETGQVIVNKTNNEFDKPIYSTTYPAYWAYSGMGLAYKNIDATFTGVNFLDGVITAGSNDLITNMNAVFESGDEIYIIGADADNPTDPCAARLATNNNDVKMLWAFDKDKNTSSLTNTTPHLIFLDSKGKPYTKDKRTIRVVRSGKRNNLGFPAATVSSMISPIVTVASTKKLQIDHTSKVINASAVEYREKWQTDNSVIKKLTIDCTTGNEIEDCTNNGYWEKSINPYLKGLLGTFRIGENKVLYTNRAETNASTKTSIPENGFIANYSNYWTFNNTPNLVKHADADEKWIFQSKITKINSKGMELETKDALGIYTAAHYGYDKTLPKAIANNARYNQINYEGFEDYSFNTYLSNNQSASSCYDKHIDWGKFDESSITANVIDVGADAIAAHSGKSVLKLNPSSTATKTIKLQNSNTEDFDLVFGNDEFHDYLNVGGIFTKDVYPISQDSKVVCSFPSYTQGGVNIVGGNQNTGLIYANHPTENYSWYSASTEQYFTVSTCKNYDFRVMLGFGDLNIHDNNMIFEINIFDNITNTHVKTFNAGNENVNWIDPNVYGPPVIDGNGCSQEVAGTNYKCDKTYSLYLPSGTYRVETSVSFYHYIGPPDNFVGFWGYFKLETNIPGPSYQNLTTTPSCPHAIPISGQDNFINTEPEQGFLNDGKKLLFSTWVKEVCATPCTKQSYTNSSVELIFLDASDNVIDANGAEAGNHIVVTPIGTIIEGWQKVEKEFVVPANAVKMKVAFKNSNTTANYWDDIRIHPFNANMKSYVYDPINLRLLAELDANNYASFYEYDAEGTLIRTKVETKEGIKTIKETRSAKQKQITELQ